MKDFTEFSLNYHFGHPDIRQLKPGDSLCSSIPPVDVTHAEPNLVFSSDGFPLEFSLHLLYVKRGGGTTHKLSLQLRLHQPRDIPFLPPVQIQPTNSLPGIPCKRPQWLERRFVGPQGPASWTFVMIIPSSGSRNRKAKSGSGNRKHNLPLKLAGVFRFQLLDEPSQLLANLPVMSTSEWPRLPQELVALILRELPLMDRVKARLVCNSWASILDTYSQAWSNVTFLEIIHSSTEHEEPSDYHGGRLNQVRDYHLISALDFLRSRKAPVRTLEYNDSRCFVSPMSLSCSGNRPATLKDLSIVLSEHKIKLKSLSYRSKQWIYPEKTMKLFKKDLVAVINSQSSMEYLYLELPAIHFPLRHLSVLSHLRVLSLIVSTYDQLNEIQSEQSLLRQLDGLRLSLNAYIGTDTSRIENLCTSLQRHNPNLRLGMGVGFPAVSYLHCGCYLLQENKECKLFVWGTANLSPTTAASLLMPTHYKSDRSGHTISHYRC